MADSKKTPDSRFLRIDEFLPLVGISRATVLREVEAGRFPPPVRLSPGRVGWRPTDIEDWVADRPATKPCSRTASRRATA